LRRHTTLLIALGGITVVALLIRVLSIAEPLGIDQGLLASAAKQLARGQTLYQNVWDQKPPGIYLTYLAAFSVFGWSPSSVAWFDILASAVTALLLFAIVRRLADTMMGAVAAALWTTLTMPSWLYRHGGFLERSVAETFVVVCVALAALCAAHLVRRASMTFAIGLGLFAGAAVMYKPNALVYLPALLLWTWLSRQWRQPHVLRVLIVASLSSAIVPAVTFVWLWRYGVLPEARVALIDFNRAYVSTGFSAERYVIDFSKAVWLRMKTDPLWAAGGIATVMMLWDVLRRRRLDPLPALAVAWGGAAALAIVVNGARLFNSYFIQALAPLAVLAAWHLTTLSRGSLGHRLAGLGTAAVMLVMLLVRSNYPARIYEFARADLEQLRGRADRTAYLEIFGGYANGRGYSARANEELAEYVRARTGHDDRIYQFGINGAGVYFAADRLAAHRFLRVNMFVLSDLEDPRFRLSTVTQEIAARRPVYLIFEQLHTQTELGQTVDQLQHEPDIVRLLENYRLETQIEDFTLYRRLHE